LDTPLDNCWIDQLQQRTSIRSMGTLFAPRA
jgi:hypothetical protein